MGQNGLFIGKNEPFVEKILNQPIAILPLQVLIEGVFDRLSPTEFNARKFYK
jgi:hypothetical protein